MKNTEQIIQSIAQEKLGIQTLETQNSDRLDFYDISVWQIKEALELAFQLGQKSGSTNG